MQDTLEAASVAGVPQTSCCDGTNETSSWTLKLSQILLCDVGSSQIFWALHSCPGSQSELVSHELLARMLSIAALFSPLSHVPPLQASPSSQSRSLSQLRPQPFRSFDSLATEQPG